MTIAVDAKRYEELLRKETTLEIVKVFHEKTSGYSFHDVVGHLLKTSADITVSADE